MGRHPSRLNTPDCCGLLRIDPDCSGSHSLIPEQSGVFFAGGLNYELVSNLSEIVSRLITSKLCRSPGFSAPRRFFFRPQTGYMAFNKLSTAPTHWRVKTPTTST